MSVHSRETALDRIRRGNFSPDPLEPGPSLKVLNWNIERGSQFEGVLEGIQEQRPDICILQEVDLNAERTRRKDVAAELARGLKLNYVFAAECQELSQGTDLSPAYHGQAILTRLPIRRHRILRFACQSNHWRPAWYTPNWSVFQPRLGGRIALVAEVEALESTLVVYSIHLESRISEEGWLQQVEEILADTAHYPPQTPVVLAGDFNPKPAGYRWLQLGRHRLFAFVPSRTPKPSPLLDRVKAAGFQDALAVPQPTRRAETGLKRWTHAFPITLSGSQNLSLDWIFLRGSLEFSQGTVHHHTVASDHFPMSVEITLLRP